LITRMPGTPCFPDSIGNLTGHVWMAGACFFLVAPGARKIASFSAIAPGSLSRHQ
jgi:hypothetical protein